MTGTVALSAAGDQRSIPSMRSCIKTITTGGEWWTTLGRSQEAQSLACPRVRDQDFSFSPNITLPTHASRFGILTSGSTRQ